MKNTKFMGIIHGMIAIVFLVVTVIAWTSRDFGFWCFVVSVLLLIGNSYGLIYYLEKHPKRGGSPIDQALFVPVAATLFIIIWITIYLPDIVNYNANKYLSAHIVVFALSVIVQFLLLQVRTKNDVQAVYTAQKRWSRDETVFQWDNIRMALANKAEAQALAKKITDEIRYSDAMSSEKLFALESEITVLTEEILRLSKDAAVPESDILNKQHQALAMIRERNDKCARLK